MYRSHQERHRISRMGWLRAGVLGANDGLVSTASLVLGVAAADASHGSILVAGVAGLVAGAMSMAAGEYVSVSSQADSEKAELDRERQELKTDDVGEHKELAAIYVARGVDAELAQTVAVQLMAHDALDAHARDELGISDTLSARPIQAAMASAVSIWDTHGPKSSDCFPRIFCHRRPETQRQNRTTREQNRDATKCGLKLSCPTGDEDKLLVAPDFAGCSAALPWRLALPRCHPK